jgi:hypothetical protein
MGDVRRAWVGALPLRDEGTLTRGRSGVALPSPKRGIALVRCESLVAGRSLHQVRPDGTEVLAADHPTCAWMLSSFRLGFTLTSPAS